VYGWADTRAGAAAERLRANFDEAATHRRTGCRFHSSYWPAKLRWLQTTQPGIFVRVRRWIGFSEYLYGSLCGEKAGQTISLSMASGTGLFDGHTRTWDATLLDALKLSSEQLPAINSADEQKAEIRLTSESAKRYPALKLIAGARWMSPVGDGATNNIGAGCTSPATMGLMIGTSGAMRVLFEAEVPASVSPSLWCYRADEKRVLVGGALSDGGGLREWVTETMTVGDNAELVEAELAKMEPDAHGLTIVPCWAGERSTNWSAHARGAILGFTMDTRPVEVLRAAMEAVAYRFAFVEQALAAFAPAAEIRASGGALRHSPAWTQVIADVTNRPVRLASVREASSRGVALLALEGLGIIKNIDEIAAPVGRTFEPNPNNHARYMAGLERQQKLYKILIEDELTARLIDYAGEQTDL
nr:carbohydrate kinase [Pyrinomonadaceae bacterium]